jgi:hypothetical protein
VAKETPQLLPFSLLRKRVYNGDEEEEIKPKKPKRGDDLLDKDILSSPVLLMLSFPLVSFRRLAGPIIIIDSDDNDVPDAVDPAADLFDEADLPDAVDPAAGRPKRPAGRSLCWSDQPDRPRTR